MKSLILYYSHSGNTRRLAELIALETGGALLEILPKTAYPQDYTTVVNQARRELQTGFRPALKTEAPDLAGYDLLFIGTPNWWSSPPRLWRPFWTAPNSPASGSPPSAPTAEAGPGTSAGT